MVGGMQGGILRRYSRCCDRLQELSEEQDRCPQGRTSRVPPVQAQEVVTAIACIHTAHLSASPALRSPAEASLTSPERCPPRRTVTFTPCFCRFLWAV